MFFRRRSLRRNKDRPRERRSGMFDYSAYEDAP